MKLPRINFIMKNASSVQECFVKAVFVWIMFFSSFQQLSAQSPDIDGDGIINSLDLDDDNDGILDTQECTVPSAVRMLSWMNGSNTFPPTYDLFTSTDLLATNSTAGAGLTRVWNAPDNYQSITAVAATTEAQAITNNEYVEYRVTVGKVPLAITQFGYYRVNSTVDDTGYTFTARVSDNNFTTNVVGHGATTYLPTATAADFTVNANNGPIYFEANKTYTIRIYFYNPGGGNAATFAHDDFKLFGYKECDRDGDGIPNRADLDSDGDGCQDAREGAGNFNPSSTASGSISSQIPNINFGTDVDGNGVSTIVGAAGQAIGQSQDSTKNDCIDSDGDGYSDWLDLDDDNDGILDSSECQSSNKITDGVFPTSGSTIPSWTTTGSFALNARGLQYDADNTVNSVRQNVSSVFSGSTINLNNVRWLTTNNASAGRLITEILYGGTVYATIDTGIGVAGSIPTVTGNNGAVTNISTLPSIASTGVYSTPSNLMITLPQTFASSGEFQIRFTTTSANSDDISIESVQLISCSDFDGDGIPNYLDLDSDGDGCPDAIEGSGNFNPTTTASGTLTSQSPNINFGTAVDANGIPTTVGASGQGIGDSLDTLKDCKDSDGDGYPDWQDLDDDNDGILDCVENGLNTTLDKIFKANNNATLIASPSTGPVHQYRLTNGTSQNGQIWSYGKVDFTKSFALSTKALLSNADGIAIVFHNSPAGQLAGGTNGQGLGARGIANGIALELDTFVNGCANDANNGENCDPNYDHGSIRTTATWINAGKLAGDGQLGDGTVDDGLWHDVVINWNSVTRNLSYTFDGVAVTNYTFPATGANALETILAGNSAYFGFTASTGGAGSNNSVGFDTLCTLPIYLDSDQDGISNHLDLDSDGDGCTDAIEGAGSFTTSQLSTASGNISTQTPNQNFGVSVDGNGIPTTVGAAGQGIGNSQDNSKNDCIDSDGDGYPDWQDLDDDNDGILDTVECSVTDLVTNGTFTGNANGWTLENSWTYNTNRVANSADGETSRLLQSISNLNKLSGNIIPLTFTVGAQDASNASGNTSALEIRLNGTLYATINNATSRDNSNVTITLEPGVMSNFTTFGTSAVNGYTTQTFTLWIPYTGPSTANLVFRKVGGNDDWSIDNVSIPAMICDTDGDGILDHLDLDSDGDGCSDAIEGDAAFTTSNLVNSSMPGGNTGGSYTGTAGPVTSNLGNTVGSTAATMGVPTIAGTGQGVGGSKIATLNNQCLDSDGDGIPDYLDLDDDNDGILDTVEMCKSAVSTDFFNGQSATVNAVSGITVVSTTATLTPAVSRYSLGWHFGDATGAVSNEMSINFNNPVYLANDGIDYDLGGMDNGSKFGNFFIVYEDGTRLSNLSISLAGISPAGGIIISTINGANAIETQAGPNTSANLTLIGVDRTKRIVKMGYTVYALNGNGATSETMRPRVQIDCDMDGDGIPNQLDLDSDNDGCLDAIEGGANITTSQLVNAGGILTVGTGSTATNQNLCADSSCVDANGVPNIVGASGQTVGDSQNGTVNSQCSSACYKPGITDAGNIYPAKHGITALGRAGAENENWPMVRQSAWTVLEAKTKGLVINRVNFNTSNQPVADDGTTLVITNPVEGMMVYDKTNNCLKIYTSNDGGSTFQWHCMSTQTCPN